MTTESPEAAAVPRPWRTIWFSPRRTMRALLAADVRPSWVAVVALAALHQAVVAVVSYPGPDGALSFNNAAMPAIVGVLQVIFGVLVGPFLLAFTGGWFGGEADPTEIRQSSAWSYAPLAVATMCWVPVLVAYGGVPVEGAAPTESAPEIVKALIFLALFVVYLFAVGWAFVLQVVTLAEVQRFSIVRAIGSMVILFIPLLLLSAMV